MLRVDEVEPISDRGDTVLDPNLPIQNMAPIVGLYQVTETRFSNVGFFVTNYGILGLDVRMGEAGVSWPAETGNDYLFGGGFWFGTKRYDPVIGQDRKMSVMSYNPNTGGSWFTPGRGSTFDRHEPIDASQEGEGLNRLYFSSEHDPITGERSLLPDLYPLWPIWLDPARADESRYMGTFLPDDPARRGAAAGGWSPAILSDEDFFSVYRDNDLERYEIGRTRAEDAGYPIGIEVQNRVYSWGSGDLKDVILLSYTIVNRSPDTLRESYFAPIWDPDIGESDNDHVSTVIPDVHADSLGMVQGWTEPNMGDVGYGYVGVDLVATPAVDDRGFVRTDREIYPTEEQVGLRTARVFNIDVDPKTPEERYDFMASEVRDVDVGAGDWRILLSTGPFTMRPGDTIRVVVALLFTEGSASIPDGTDNDQLVQLSSRLQRAFDAGIRGVSGVDGELMRAIHLLDLE